MKTWQLLKNDPSLFDRYFTKEYVISACRKFFEELGYHELESPILSEALPQERYSDVLETQIDLKGSKKKLAYLIPTTETFNKKILAAGLGEHFVISKVFRGLEDMGPNHSPEFTMLEWYHLDANYFDLMDDVERLFRFVKQFLDKKFGRRHDLEFVYQGESIDLKGNWERLSLVEGLEKFANVKLSEVQDLKKFQSLMKAKGYKISKSDDWQLLFELLFANEIEPFLSKNKPTFVYDYPYQVCPLTKTSRTNPLVCEKVELYIAGKELANGYTELRDWQEQERRFKLEQRARVKLGKRRVKFDHDLINALKSGIPPVAGIGMGIDRVAMLFADAKNVSDVNYFPANELFGKD